MSVLAGLTLLVCGSLTFAQENQEKKPAELQEFFTLVEQEVEPVVTGVSRPMMQEDVPASITVVTAEELKLLGLRSLTDIINYIVPGGVGDIHRSSRTGLYAFRGITVDNNGKYVFMVDGLNVGELSQWGAFNERYLGLMDELDRIEIIQGTGSILYGSGAISGIINFITKTGNDFQGTELTAGYGSWSKLETSLKLGKKAANPDEWTYYLYGGYKNSHGSVPREGELNTQTETSGDGRYWDHFDHSGKVHANLTKGDFTLRMRYVRDRFEEPYVNSNTSLNTSDCFWFENYMFIQPEYVHKIDDVSSIKANVSFVMNETGMEKTTDWYRGSNVLIIEKGHKQNTAGERKFRGQLFHYYDGFANHKLTSGLEYFWMYAGPDFVNEDYSIRYGSGAKIKEPKIWDRETFDFIAFFMEDMWKLNEKITIFAGGRVEDHSLTPINFSPRIAVSYDHDEKTNFKLLYNRGFRTPDWVYYDVNKRTAGAVDPKPEKVDSFEGHIIHKFNPKFTMTTIAYYTIYKDLINYYTGHGYYNYPTVKAAGLEVSGDYKDENLKLVVSHSYSTPMDIPDDNFNIVSLSYDNDNWAQFPTHMTKAHAIINLVKDKLLLGITYFRPWGIKGQKNASEALKAGADYVNATVTYKVNKNFELQLSGYNLTGEDHPWWGASTQNGISRSIDPHTEWFARMIWKF